MDAQCSTRDVCCALCNSVACMLQVLSFPLSASRVLGWQPTMLARFTDFLSIVAMRSLGNGDLEVAATFISVGVAVATSAAIAFIGVAAASESPVPRWLIQVGLFMAMFRCMRGSGCSKGRSPDPAAGVTAISLRIVREFTLVLVSTDHTARPSLVHRSAVCTSCYERPEAG